MTVIAWDGEVLAADRQAVSDGCSSLVEPKIGCTSVDEFGGDFLYGYVGDIAEGEELLDWVTSGAKKKKFPEHLREANCNTLLVVIREDNTVAEYFRSPYPVLHPEGEYAWGSGGPYALGAMAAGATAAQAAEIATTFDVNSGGGIIIVSFRHRVSVAPL